LQQNWKLEKAHLKLLEAIQEDDDNVILEDRFNWAGKRAIFVMVAMVETGTGMC
jgi:hypothetical protein